MEPLYNFVNKYQDGAKCLGIVIAIGGITVILSALCAWILILLDRKRSANSTSVFITNEESEIPKIKLKDALSFRFDFWLIVLICFLFYSTQFPFISLSKTYLMGKYSWTASETSLQQRQSILILKYRQTLVFKRDFALGKKSIFLNRLS
jgi:hypothetical protein